MHTLFFVSLFLAFRQASAETYGCFSSVDTSVSEGTLQYGSQDSCSSACGTSYPYVAMKNGGDCYCLSSLPTSSTSSSQCSVTCYGYGQSVCGGTNAYTVFDNTKYSGSGSSGNSESSASSSSRTSNTSQGGRSSTSVSSTSSTNGAPATSSIIPTVQADSSSTSDSNPRVTSIVTTMSSNADGSSSVQYRTVTTTSGPSASPSSNSDSGSSSKKSSSNVGPIVGGVVGGVAAVALVFAIFFFIRRRNARDDDDEEDFFKKGSAGSTGSGNVSRARSNKISPVFDTPMANPFEHPSDDIAEKLSNKTTHGLTDPRLNPVMMGRRRLSEGSLADETDYSRKILGVANP